MTTRREILAFGLLGGAVFVPSTARAAGDCRPVDATRAMGAALLDKYVAAVNAHDTSSFGEIFAEGYIQHSGRSRDGLAAQVDNFKSIFGRMPDVRMHVDDLI